jgi:hypothetical protein
MKGKESLPLLLLLKLLLKHILGFQMIILFNEKIIILFNERLSCLVPSVIFVKKIMTKTVVKLKRMLKTESSVRGLMLLLLF